MDLDERGDGVDTTMIDAACERAHQASVAALVEISGLPERAIDAALRQVIARRLAADYPSPPARLGFDR